MDRALELDRTAATTALTGYLPETWWQQAGSAIQNRCESDRRDPATNASPTLDGLFRRILARQPDALALLDPLNKQRITGQPPKRLTFAQADRAISALSAHFIDAGLPANSVIAMQLPNTDRIRADGAGRASRRTGRGAAAAALAAGGIDGRAQSHRRARDRDHEPDRRRHSCRSGHERGGGSLFDPPCLRLRQRFARRHGLARPCASSRNPPRTRAVDAGRPQGGGDLVRRDAGWLSCGAAHASQSDCRRPRDCRSKAMCRRARRSCRHSRRRRSRA